MNRYLTFLPALALLAGQAGAAPLLPQFDPANFPQTASIDNPYLPFVPGFRAEVVGVSRDDAGERVEERTLTTHAGPGPVIAGVTTVMMEDVGFVGTLMIEQTNDYYAQDMDGNVWYLGEDVVNIHYDDEDKEQSRDAKGTWRAGVNAALPGYAMPEQPAPGFAYQQEHAPADQAMDWAEIMAVGGTLDIAGLTYCQVVSIFESSTAEPSLREVKHYAPGVGLIREDESVDAARANPQAHFDLVPAGK